MEFDGIIKAHGLSVHNKNCTTFYFTAQGHPPVASDQERGIFPARERMPWHSGTAKTPHEFRHREGAYTVEANPLKSPHHDAIRGFLRVAGPLLMLAGVGFMATGMVSFFSAFGSFDGPPRYFWCFFVGVPLLGVGLILSKLGYMGAISRYIAGELAPVAKDGFNDVAQGIEPGVRSISRSVAEGYAEGSQGRRERGE